jgi:hypothetical protein
MPENPPGKDPRRVETGRRGMAVRWGRPENRRRAYLHNLTPDQRRAVLDLIAAYERANGLPAERPAGPVEVDR